MASLVRVGIAGTGSCVPGPAVPNEWFESRIDTSDEWITQRTGIKNRHWVAPDQATSDLCVAAAERAIEKSGVAPEDLDLIVVGTLTPDFLLPSTSCLVQHRIGARNAGAFDVNAACTGFLAALHTAEAYVASGRAKRVLAVGAESLSRFLDYEDRTSCVIFGDAAGAAVLTPLSEAGQGEILKTSLGADGSGFHFIHMEAGGSKLPASAETVAARKHFIRLRGRDVYRFAVTKMSDLIAEMLDEYGEDDIGLIVPHQVNKRIIQAAMERLELSEEKVMINIEKYGNTSAATVPLALDEAIAQGRLVKGKLVVLVAFGAGLTWGATLLRW